MAKRLIVLDYEAVRKAFDEEFKATRKLIESGETHLDNLAEGFTEADRVLRKMPTVDAVEVVRCKYCCWRGSENCAMFYRCDCGEQHTWETDNDFCSYGKRRTTMTPKEDV